MTDAAGQRVAQHDYYPFGVEATSIRQDVVRGFDREEPARFTGHERDFNAGTLAENQGYLDYMHARYYSPALGRFLSVDPLLDSERATRQPQRWNRYSYVLNNPINLIDPDGRTDQCPTCKTEAEEEAVRRLAGEGNEFAMMRLEQTPPGLDVPVLDPTQIIAGAAAIGFARLGMRSTATWGFTSRAHLVDHAKHATEMGFRSLEAYGAAAKAFVGTAGRAGIRTETLKDGTRYIYNAATKEFAVVGRNGKTITYHKMAEKKFEKMLRKRLQDEGQKIAR